MVGLRLDHGKNTHSSCLLNAAIGKVGALLGSGCCCWAESHSRGVLGLGLMRLLLFFFCRCSSLYMWTMASTDKVNQDPSPMAAEIFSLMVWSFDRPEFSWGQVLGNINLALTCLKSWLQATHHPSQHLCSSWNGWLGVLSAGWQLAGAIQTQTAIFPRSASQQPAVMHGASWVWRRSNTQSLAKCCTCMWRASKTSWHTSIVAVIEQTSHTVMMESNLQHKEHVSMSTVTLGLRSTRGRKLLGTTCLVWQTGSWESNCSTSLTHLTYLICQWSFVTSLVFDVIEANLHGYVHW